MTALKDLRVHIVDDYTTMLRILRNLLRQLDIMDVEESTNGGDAFTKMLRNPPGLIISDWNMEPMTGLDLLKKVRADTTLRRIPFIMVTAESKTENVIAAKQAGVSNYIVKPFNAETLQAKISSVMGARAA
ncbi:MAG: response regulator [Rhizomicrobium sp.]